MEKSLQQPLFSLENVHVIVKVTPMSQKHVLQGYLLCEEILCSWDQIDKLVECYCYPKLDSHNFIIQETSSDFLLINYSSHRNKTKAFNLTELDCHTNLALNNICWDVCQIQNLNSFGYLKIKINNMLFRRLMFELYGSKIYRKNYLLNICNYYNKKYKDNMQVQNYLCSNCQNTIWKFDVLVLLSDHEQNCLDIAWNNRIERLILEKCELENAMAWLSTLGGAFSALGDVFVHCAKKAGDISVQQLQIALQLGDPLTICRCQIYIAMSLLQMGYYKKTKQMIRELYAFSTTDEGKRDFRLKNMCIAVWNRLKYVRSLTMQDNKYF